MKLNNQELAQETQKKRKKRRSQSTYSNGCEILPKNRVIYMTWYREVLVTGLTKKVISIISTTRIPNEVQQFQVSVLTPFFSFT